MKLEDITYILTDKVMVPPKMGVIATDLYDCSISLKHYEEDIPELEIVTEICNLHSYEQFENIVSDTPITPGFYKKHIHFFIVETLSDDDIIYFPRIADSDSRHWINGKLYFIGHDQTVYTVRLKKGKNIFCIEHAFDVIPFVRIEKRNTQSNELVSLTHANYWYKSSDFIVNLKSAFIQNDNLLKFNLFPVDLINFTYESRITMKLMLENKEVLYEKEISFKENYCIDLSFVPNMHEDEYERLYVLFVAKNNNGENSAKKIVLYRYFAKATYTSELKKEASLLLADNNVPELIKNELSYYLYIMQFLESDTYYGRYIKNILLAKKNNSLTEYIYKPGPHCIYYYSNIDSRYHYYFVVLPKSFNIETKYPLLLTISHGSVDENNKYNNYSAKYMERDGAIYADIGEHGNTHGSYIGEAFLLMEINHILEHFPIDRSKIFVTGNCGGNGAVFNLLQNYPHLFAGAYTIHANIDYKRINNLYNINWLHLVATVDESPTDFFQVNRKCIEKELKNFRYLFAQKYIHPYLPSIQYTASALGNLMSYKLNEYPEIIYYRTERNRARQAYYIEIESIAPTKTFAEISCEIIAYNLVISAKNCTGLKIKLPPQIDREDFAVKINGKTIRFKKYYSEVLILKHSNTKGYFVADELDNNICYYKGTGLLDVYLTPMRVLNCMPKDDILAKVSSVFAHPITNTTHPQINVIYPIKPIVDIKGYLDCALTIIDNNTIPTKELEFVKQQLHIHMDDVEFKYNGDYKVCKYCIMQIVNNPWCKGRSILYINTNDKRLYSRNFFTRKMIIPSYSSGFHPYLNAVALLYDGEKYYTIKDWGDDFMEVH